MKVFKTFMTLFLFGYPAIANAQFCVWGDVGMAQQRTSIQFTDSRNNHTDVRYSTRYSISIFFKPKRKVNLGLSTYLESYFYSYDSNPIVYYIFNGVQYGVKAILNSEVQDTHRSTFVYFAPALSYRIDKKGKWFINLLPSLGLRLGGNDNGVYSGVDRNGNYFRSNVYFNSGSNTARSVLRLGIQIHRQIHLFDSNYLTSSLGYSIMSGSLTTRTQPFTDLAPQVLSLSIGYMRQFKNKSRAQ